MENNKTDNIWYKTSGFFKDTVQMQTLHVYDRTAFTQSRLHVTDGKIR